MIQKLIDYFWMLTNISESVGRFFQKRVRLPDFIAYPLAFLIVFSAALLSVYIIFQMVIIVIVVPLLIFNVI